MVGCSHFGKIVAVSLDCGKLFWELVLPDRIESTPAYDEGKHIPEDEFNDIVIVETDSVLVGCYDHHLYCVGAEEGDILWKHDFGGMVKTSPLLLDQSLVCGSYQSCLVKRLISRTGAKVWSRDVEGSVLASPQLTDDGNILVATLRGRLYCLTSESGKDHSIGLNNWKAANAS